jgi:hypothetical protein
MDITNMIGFFGVQDLKAYRRKAYVTAPFGKRWRHNSAVAVGC